MEYYASRVIARQKCLCRGISKIKSKTQINSNQHTESYPFPSPVRCFYPAPVAVICCSARAGSTPPFPSSGAPLPGRAAPFPPSLHSFPTHIFSPVAPPTAHTPPPIPVALYINSSLNVASSPTKILYAVLAYPSAILASSLAPKAKNAARRSRNVSTTP